MGFIDKGLRSKPTPLLGNLLRKKLKPRYCEDCMQWKLYNCIDKGKIDPNNCSGYRE